MIRHKKSHTITAIIILAILSMIAAAFSQVTSVKTAAYHQSTTTISPNSASSIAKTP